MNKPVTCLYCRTCKNRIDFGVMATAVDAVLVHYIREHPDVLPEVTRSQFRPDHVQEALGRLDR